MKRTLILLRHGESEYNKAHLFTGWTDVELSEQGRAEAKHAGKLLAEHGIYPDICFTSWLKRAIHTAQIALGEMGWEHIDCLKSWKLNERHYGDWQGRNKDEVKAEVGEEHFLAVRRGYDTPPPPLPKGDPRSVRFEKKYFYIDPSELPQSESLKDTRKRAWTYYQETIVPTFNTHHTILVSAHGNSLRALVMGLEGLTPEEIVHVEIPTGQPLIYTLDETGRVIEKTHIS
jgi:2,3-bisphosphoglycerate-dependent phosphoglycerate mutase